jgi:hypothetical protein
MLQTEEVYTAAEIRITTPLVEKRIKLGFSVSKAENFKLAA